MKTVCTIAPDGSGAPVTDLRAYIEHKTGSSLEEIDRDSHERFLVIEAEALRDIIVMAEISGTGACIRLLPGTEDNPDCRRLISAHCR